MRSCIACRVAAPQDTLLRFERRADGEVVLAAAAHTGRSAYVCPTRGCFERALARQAFARALRLGAIRRPTAWPAILEPWREELRASDACGRRGRRQAALHTLLARCELGRTATITNETAKPVDAAVAPTERRLDGVTDVRGEGGS
jgi:predicted RNA-binding protein YlxR (DUF448 family)